MILMGYSLALLMGLSLGLIGAGGSILSVPIFVYLLNVKPTMAISYSLLVVGVTALIGSISYFKKGQVYWREALLFAIPAMLSVVFIRVYIMPVIPAQLLGMSKDDFFMFIFALIMILASIMMFRTHEKVVDWQQKKWTVDVLFQVVLGSFTVGIITGLVGVGGGFLIIPGLMMVYGFTMKQAVGTSLLIIAINALAGFNGELAVHRILDWSVLGIFVLMTTIGVIVGSLMTQYVNASFLRKTFAAFSLSVGVLILVTLFKNNYGVWL